MKSLNLQPITREFLTNTGTKKSIQLKHDQNLIDILTVRKNKISYEKLKEQGNILYYPAFFLKNPLPSKTGMESYRRTIGKDTLVITAGIDSVDGTRYEVPAGTRAILLMSYIATEAKKQKDFKNPKITFDKSFSEFLKGFGLKNNGDTHREFKRQFLNILHAQYCLIDEDKNEQKMISVFKQNITCFRNEDFDQTEESYIELSADFADLLRNQAKAYHKSAIVYLKSKYLALHMYMLIEFERYKAKRFKEAQEISYRRMYERFGASSKDFKKFKSQANDALYLIRALNSVFDEDRKMWIEQGTICSQNQLIRCKNGNVKYACVYISEEAGQLQTV